MKKYLRLLWIILLLLILMSIPASANPFEKEDTAETNVNIPALLTDRGISLMRVDMTGWALINNKYMSLDDLIGLSQSVMKSMKGFDFVGQTAEENGQVRQITQLYTNHGNEYSVTFNNGVNPYNENQKYETYIVVNAAITENMGTAGAAVQEDIERIISGFSGEPHIGTTYTAGVSGKLENGRMDRLCRQIFRCLKGKITEGITDNGLISRTGYTDEIKNCLNVNGKNININVSLRYNEYEDMTYVWLGTPVITIAY